MLDIKLIQNDFDTVATALRKKKMRAFWKNFVLFHWNLKVRVLF